METLISILAQAYPPPAPWPGPLTYIGVAMLLAALFIYVMNRRAPKDDAEEHDNA
jgi:hypothetical protein